MFPFSFDFCRRWPQVYPYTCDNLKLLHMWPHAEDLDTPDLTQAASCIAESVGIRIASSVVFLVLLISARLSRCIC